ncbi:MAG: orotidine-5'-phosphate decarboxylase [Lysobacterales bacterium]|jgi:orotidine-5'-phosphate decarboxylase
MIRKTANHRFHVSNHAAILAALILVFTSFTGFTANQDFDQQYMDKPEASVAQSAENAEDKASESRKLNISLLLFGKG